MKMTQGGSKRMVKGLKRVVAVMAMLAAFSMTGRIALAQNDEAIDAIRDRDSIPETDQDRLARWLGAKVDSLGSATDMQQAFDALNAEFRDTRNSDAFTQVLVTELAKIAVNRYARSSLGKPTAFALSHQLSLTPRVETVPALLAGLKSSHSFVRYKSARSLGRLSAQIAGDDAMFTQVRDGIRDAALAEEDPVALRYELRALSSRERIAQIVPVFISVLDKRIEARQNPTVKADGAELGIYENLARQDVLDGLSQPQQVELVKRLARLFRIDVTRYNHPRLAAEGEITDEKYREVARLERMLVAVEDILARMVQGGTRKIPGELQNGGIARNQQIRTIVYEWIGDAATSTEGRLNSAPWNIPVGAP